MTERQRGKNLKRLQISLALGAASVSLAIPLWSSEPPAGDKTSTPNKVIIRFPDEKSPLNAGTPSAGTTIPSDGKLTDAGRTAYVGPPPKSDSNGPITVATAEERNQQIALDWKNPSVVFFVSGKQYGYMEPCGCTGLENQKGGLSRRDTLLTSIRDRGWEVIAIDGGNQVRRRGYQSEIKFDWTTNAFDLMGYQATTFGEDDLQLGIGSLLLPMTAAKEKGGLFVSANIEIDPNYDVPFKVLQVKNKKIAITGVLGEESSKKVESKDLKVSPPIDALKKVMAKIKAEQCDFVVLIAQATLEESSRYARDVPGFSLIVTSGGFGEPTFRPELIEGTQTQMIQVGIKGMYAGLFGLFDDPNQPFRYQRIALSSQFADSPRIADLFGKYQDQLKAVGIEGLGLRPVSHPSSREFVGSEKCGDCHTKAFEIWKQTPHAHATDSIVEPPERTMARHFDPECLSCHVTGWNPQKFHPYRTGFESLQATSHMVANGCENCHGPGAKHAGAERGEFEADKTLIERLRNEMKLPMDKARDKCLECHDIDNSPDFHKDGAFEDYWSQVKHYGKD